MNTLSCEDARRLIAAYVDGELVCEDRAAFETHVRGCEGCGPQLDREREVVEAVRAVLLPPRAPDALRARVEAALAASRPPRRRWLPTLRAAAVLAVLTLPLAVWLTVSGGPSATVSRSEGADLATVAADTHLRYTRGQLPLEIDSERPEEVSRWFAGRVPFDLALPDYPLAPNEQKPYRLLGGRLVSFRNDYAAYVAYRMEDRPISLLVTSASLAQPSGGETVPFGALVFHQQSAGGLKVITWTDKGLTYALASDLAVSGARSCIVCHGSPEERRRMEGFSGSPGT